MKYNSNPLGFKIKSNTSTPEFIELQDLISQSYTKQSDQKECENFYNSISGLKIAGDEFKDKKHQERALNSENIYIEGDFDFYNYAKFGTAIAGDTSNRLMLVNNSALIYSGSNVDIDKIDTLDYKLSFAYNETLKTHCLSLGLKNPLDTTATEYSKIYEWNYGLAEKVKIYLMATGGGGGSTGYSEGPLAWHIFGGGGGSGGSGLIYYYLTTGNSLYFNVGRGGMGRINTTEDCNGEITSIYLDDSMLLEAAGGNYGKPIDAGNGGEVNYKSEYKLDTFTGGAGGAGGNNGRGKSSENRTITITDGHILDSTEIFTENDKSSGSTITFKGGQIPSASSYTGGGGGTAVVPISSIKNSSFWQGGEAGGNASINGKDGDPGCGGGGYCNTSSTVKGYGGCGGGGVITMWLPKPKESQTSEIGMIVATPMFTWTNFPPSSLTFVLKSLKNYYASNATDVFEVYCIGSNLTSASISEYEYTTGKIIIEKIRGTQRGTGAFLIKCKKIEKEL